MGAIQESFLGVGMASCGFGERQRSRHSGLREERVPGDLKSQGRCGQLEMSGNDGTQSVKGGENEKELEG